jgi:hypothetical protein
MNLAKTWLDADLARGQESQNALFLEGLGFSNQVLLFEPDNRTLMASVSEMWAALATREGLDLDGGPRSTALNRIAQIRAFLLVLPDKG